jgi:hypothetical protein
VTNESELRRQATAAGVFLELPRTQPYSGEYPSTVPPSFQAVELTPPLTADETEQLLVWLDRWQEQPRERHEVAWCCMDCGTLDQEPLPSGTLGWGRCNNPKHPPVKMPIARLPIVYPLLDPPAGFELVRKVWCPRCDRAAGDPLGRPVQRIGWRGIEWVLASARSGGHIGAPIVKPPAPEREIGPGCEWGYRTNEGKPLRVITYQADSEGYVSPKLRRLWGKDGQGRPVRTCGTCRLYRWGLRRSYVDTCSIETRLSTEECVRVNDPIETRLSTECATPPD